MGKIIEMMQKGYQFKADNLLYIDFADEFHDTVADFFASGILTRIGNVIKYTEKGTQLLCDLFRTDTGYPDYLNAVLLVMERTGQIKRNSSGNYELPKKQTQINIPNYVPQTINILCAYNATFALDPIRWFLLYTEHPNKSRTIPRTWTLKSPDGQLVIVKNMVTWIRAHPEYFGSDDRSVRRTYIAFKRIAHCMRLGSSRRISCKGWTIARLPE